MKIYQWILIMLFFAVVWPRPVYPAEGGAAPDRAEYEISRSFMGAYKKTMRFRTELAKYAEKYDLERFAGKYNIPSMLDFVIVLAMYESGGNDKLVSHASAKDILQVIPRTRKAMKVESYREAGVKYIEYLAKMRQAETLGWVVRAYNGGPGNARRGLVPVESLHYLIGVGTYYNLYVQRKAEIEQLARNLHTLTLTYPRTWQELSVRLNTPVIELRLYNPYLSFFFPEEVPTDRLIVYPGHSRGVTLNTMIDNDLEHKLYYEVRRGDILQNLANAFFRTSDKNCDPYKEMRQDNHLILWGALHPGTRIDVTGSPYLKPDKKPEVKSGKTSGEMTDVQSDNTPDTGTDPSPEPEK